MYRAILPEGQIVCDRYEHEEEGLELFNDADEFIAFVPYSNLHALLNEDVYESNERSIM